MLNKLLGYMSKNKSILLILTVGFLIRLFVLINYQNNMTLFSDDSRYVISGIEFLKTGRIMYDGNTESTVFMMPGLAFLLSLIFSITGYTELGLLMARLPFIFIGLLSIFGLYLICNRIFNKHTGYIAAFLLALSFPHVSLDNMFLTESPFICITIYFVYYSIRFCDSKKNNDFLILLSLYLIGIIFKPTIGLLPIAFIPYYLHKKLPIKLIVSRGLFAVVIVVLFMTPWWVRNYQIVGEFLPFTGNQGDTKLLGTYQGIGYPNEPKMDDIAKYLNNKSSMGEYKHRYFQFKEKGEIADARIKEWFNNNPKGFFYSYLIYKPIKILSEPFYDIKIFDINRSIVKGMQLLLVLFSAIGVSVGLYKFRKNSMFFSIFLILLIVIYFVYLNSFYLAHPRYSAYIMPFIFIIAAYIIDMIVNKVKSIALKL
ncbi:glycosyltransferase family 39 protein [Paenibacillus profundus]|uniref:Glycosyltransferase family 39 protein n=1 Tax=Paenibacillus profundus TaxID=1173085 RepID=A0ABS8YFY4_9BACL|nr:glycosyltransferase family 39 protein [Paenibacillus profundus]MCE5169388.1 glycosyltransferase family 39 protein [Paenibacillus profundus]